MPHCNDWVPLGILLALLPLLGFWQHRDNKNHESKQQEEKEERVVTTVRARFYRQNPYFIVDVPLYPGNTGQRTQRPTHLSVYGLTIDPRFPPIAIQTIRNEPQLIYTRGNPDRTPPLAGEPDFWVQFLRNPDRLRIWRPIPADSSLDKDRDWFNGNSFALININPAGTTRTVLGRVQINVPATRNSVVQEPSFSDLIPYQNTPFLTPEDLPDDWPGYFDFGVVKLADGAEGQTRFSFLLPATYTGNWPLTFRAFRTSVASLLDSNPPTPRPDATFTPIGTDGRRMEVSFPSRPDEDAEDDVFDFDMFRTRGTTSYKVAQTGWWLYMCDLIPELCPPIANMRTRLAYRQ